MNSYDAEVAVVGGLLLDPVVDRVLSSGLDHTDFSDPTLSIIYETILKMYSDSKPIDMMTVRDYIDETNKNTNCNFEYLANISNTSLGSKNIEVYSKHIRNCRVHNDMEILKKQINYDNYQETVDKIHKLELDITNEDTNSMSSIIDKTIEHIDNVRKYGTGLSTGLNSIDSLLKGLRGGTLVVMAGRPSMGKSTLALNFANNISKTHNVLFFSLEMSQVQLMLKIIASETRINQTNVDMNDMTDKEEERFYSNLATSVNKGLSIVETVNLSVKDIVSKSRQANGKKKLDCIVIDYLQMLKYDKGKEVSELGNITRELKFLSKELEIPILLLSQLSRGVEQRENKRPLMSDLRSSGEIEQDADVIMMIYRDEYYTKEESLDKGMAEIIITKNRTGTVGWVKCRFEGQYSLFSDDTIDIYDK